MSPDYLEIYLDDHRAASAALVRLVRRVLNNNRSSQWAPDLRKLTEVVEQDAATLDRLAEALGKHGGSLKRIAGLAVERVARLKLNGHILTYSPLSRLLELEGLMAALQFKRSMWESLDRLVVDPAPLEGLDAAEMQARAASQQETVRPILEWAATELAGN